MSFNFNLITRFLGRTVSTVRYWGYIIFVLSLSTGSLAGILGNPVPVKASPLLANYYLDWHIDDQKAQELAKWNVVVLDMENQVTSPDALRKMRQLNPKIKIFAYITSEEIRDDAVGGSSVMRKRLAGGIQDNWYLYTTNHTKLSFWPGTSMLNMTPSCPTDNNGYKYNKYLAHFVADQILSSGLWDGVFYDNVWQDVNWFTKGQADANLDGQAEQGSDIDNQWRAGYRFLFNETRRIVDQKYLILGNTGPGFKQYREELNGEMQESFPLFGWKYSMDVFGYQTNGGPGPRINIINANTNNTGNRNDYRGMRYGLASTLMHNGYFSFDFGTNDHTQTWWYDEYDVKLGDPLGIPTAIDNGKTGYDESTVWQREYTNGIALVNPSTVARTVDLGEDYEKINGTQDHNVNNGQITSQVQLDSKDGILLLRTLQKVTNTVFINGSFLRFFNQQGGRVRNGIFASENGVSGGATIYRGDLNNDGNEEKIVVNGSQVQFFNRDGQVIASDYPYGTNYTGGINLAVGRLSAGDPLSVIISPKVGNTIIVYNYFGQKIKDGWQPLGPAYQGGYSVAIGDTDNDGRSEVLVGVGQGRLGEVLVFSNQMEKAIRRFTPYLKFTGGISVATTDINGDGKKEIVTYPLSGTNPVVRTFDGNGKKLGEFQTRGILGSTQGILGSADVNGDGKDEIVLMSAQ
jgi:hypothetical protein